MAIAAQVAQWAFDLPFLLSYPALGVATWAALCWRGGVPVGVAAPAMAAPEAEEHVAQRQRSFPIGAPHSTTNTCVHHQCELARPLLSLHRCL